MELAPPTRGTAARSFRNPPEIVFLPFTRTRRGIRMTGDEFHTRYALLEQVADGAARSFHAVAPGGDAVMVHFLDDGEAGASRELLAALERLEPGRRARVREVAPVDGGFAVVTDRLPDFRSLPAWINADSHAPLPASPVGDPPAAPQGPGEFTRLFKPLDRSAPSDPSLPDDAMRAAPEPLARVAPPSVEPAAALETDAATPGSAGAKVPGDFTRTFAALRRDEPAAAPPSSVSGGSRTPEARTEPPADPAPSSRALPEDDAPPLVWSTSGAGGAERDAGRPPAADRHAGGMDGGSGATGAFAAGGGPRPGGTADPPESAGALTRLFERLELPESAQPREHGADPLPFPTPRRADAPADRPVDDGYLDLQHTPASFSAAGAPSANVPPAAPSPPPSFGLAAEPAPAPAPALATAQARLEEPAADAGASRPNVLLVGGLAAVAFIALLIVVLVLAG